MGELRSWLRVIGGLAAVGAAAALLASSVLQWEWGAPDETRPGAAADSAAVQAEMGERVRVEVLNAGGRPDMARRATELLRNRGFDVVYFGNAESFDQERSTVLDRVDRPDAARAVAEALGISGVGREPDGNLYLDVTVRLGSNWEPSDARLEAEDDSTAWWNPRSLLREMGP